MRDCEIGIVVEIRECSRCGNLYVGEACPFCGGKEYSVWERLETKTTPETYWDDYMQLIDIAAWKIRQREYEQRRAIEGLDALVRELPEAPKGTATRYVREDRDSN